MVEVSLPYVWWIEVDIDSIPCFSIRIAKANQWEAPPGVSDGTHLDTVTFRPAG